VGSCLSIIAFFDLISQLTFSIFTEKFQISNKKCFLIGAVSISFLRILLINFSSLKYLLVISAFLGYFRNLLNVNYKLIVAEYCTNKYPEKLASGFSLSMLMNSIFISTLGLFFGWARNSSSFRMSFWYQNFCIAAIPLLWFFFSD
jgi:hypothetical protein